MGLADRFKDKLEVKDIFKKTEIELSLNQQDIQFISKPVTENVTIQPKIIHSGQIQKIEKINDIKKEEQNVEQNCNDSSKFEELETEIIDKIRKTPYWVEYSLNKQEAMIAKYFDVKIQNKYSEISFTEDEKQIFIENILTLSNNR